MMKLRVIYVLNLLMIQGQEELPALWRTGLELCMYQQIREMVWNKYFTCETLHLVRNNQLYQYNMVNDWVSNYSVMKDLEL